MQVRNGAGFASRWRKVPLRKILAGKPSKLVARSSIPEPMQLGFVHSNMACTAMVVLRPERLPASHFTQDV